VTILLLDFGEETKMSLRSSFARGSGMKSFPSNALLSTALLSDMRPEVVPVLIIVSVTAKKVVT
jgi:hypothetical protein